MKKWIILALMMLLGACTADYDTFDTSDYRELKEIAFLENIMRNGKMLLNERVLNLRFGTN